MSAPRIFTPLNLLLLLLIAAATIAGFFRLPAEAQLPVHYDIFGQPDRFAGRNEALILVPAIGLGMLALFWAIARFANPERLAGGRHVMATVLPALLVMFLALQVVLVFQLDAAVPNIVAWLVATLLVALGNVMPKSQPNRYGGIRIPSTLSDPANWAATHRLTGLAMMVAGGLLILLTLLTAEPVVLFTGILVAVIVPLAMGVIYSMRFAQKGRG